MEELDNIIEMLDENGETARFELLDVEEYEGKDYAVMLPEGEDEAVVILEIQEQDDETEVLVSVESEEIVMEVFNLFKNKFKDEFDFEN